MSIDVAPEIIAQVQKHLQKIQVEGGVRILFACESGSRAWGFPSPDSDYNVRFIYAHGRDWYLSLLEDRDVIEKNLDGDLDIGGWDLRKALRLMAKSNAIPWEWLQSPILFTPAQHVRVESKDFVPIRQYDFLSKLCQVTFANYALGQVKKAKGLNKKIVNPMPARLDSTFRSRVPWTTFTF